MPISSGLLRLLLLATLAVEPAESFAADRHYGSPTGLELRIETELDAPGAYLEVNHFDSTGRSQPLIQPVHLSRPSNTGEFSGKALAHGRLQQITVVLSEDGRALTWLQPDRLVLPNGDAVQIAGQHPLLAQAARKSAAEAGFAAADKRLNAAYGLLREGMDVETFAELRANQRLWLKYRDLFVADGDDAEINGPGSVPFLRQQIARTLDRVQFLQSMAKPVVGASQLSGVYSDGIDRNMHLRSVSGADGPLFFQLGSAHPRLHDKGHDEPIIVSGRASADAGGRSWTANGDGTNRNPIVSSDSELLIEPAADHRSVLLSSASSAVFTGRLYFVGPLQAASAPMREILRRLPAAVFDHTTEGLTESDKTPLLLADRSEPFQLQDAGADFIRVDYAEGSVTLRRFPRHDGGAVVAVDTSNVQARNFELWSLQADGSAAGRMSLGEILPSLAAKDFFTDPDVAHSAQGRVDYRLREDRPAIDIQWLVDDEGPDADHLVELSWDGFGFGGHQRRAR